MRRIFILIMAMALLAAGRVHAQVTLLSDNRSVSVSVEAPSPPALNSSDSGTQTPSTPFGDLNLKLNRSIGWQEVDGWQADPASASAIQNATFSSSQITLDSHLSVSVGGDPYGYHFPPGASGTAQAISYFEVTFSIAGPLEYSYLFDFDISPTLQTADCTLSSVNHGVQQLFRTHETPITGLLETDTYTLSFNLSILAAGDQAGDNYGSMTFTLAPDLTVIPEPSTSLLLGLALFGLLALKAKRAQKQAARAMALQRSK